MIKRTKIVSTLGPASNTPEMIEKLILAGANVFRLNFSHGEPEDHKQRADMVRAAAAKLNTFVAILGDLQGPKIRIARFKDTKVILKKNDTFTLDVDLGKDEGDNIRVGIDYPQLPTDSNPGDMLLLDDGRIVLEVREVQGNKVICRVDVGGPLSNNKGINKLGGGLSAEALTEKDKRDIITAAEIDVDYIAVSFPRSAEDMNYARKLLTAAGSNAALVAKVERAEAVNDLSVLDGIILASDAVMVARGDLGVEIGDAELIGVQKHMILRARQLNRIVITATQMMETMISSPIPTRAEVFDVANAVLDGTDAVMLSAETAAGDYPEETVLAMTRVCIGAEKQPSTKKSGHRLDREFTTPSEAAAMAAMYTANHMKDVKAILCLTETGYTPLMMSRIRSGLPIYALTPNVKTQRLCALYRGVEAIPFDASNIEVGKIGQAAVAALVKRGILSKGDLVVMTKGDKTGVHGNSNSMKILSVE